jgi:hypothetical protein
MLFEFFRNGGMPMGFVLGLGALAVLSALRFMGAPDRRRVATVISLSVATAFSALTGVATDLAVTAHYAAASDQAHALTLQGFSESMSPAILGGVFLTVTWMIMAAGFRRLAARLPP